MCILPVGFRPKSFPQYKVILQPFNAVRKGNKPNQVIILVFSSATWESRCVVAWEMIVGGTIYTLRWSKNTMCVNGSAWRLGDSRSRVDGTAKHVHNRQLLEFFVEKECFNMNDHMISLPCTCGDGKYACDFHEISECGGLLHFFYHDKAGFMSMGAQG